MKAAAALNKYVFIFRGRWGEAVSAQDCLLKQQQDFTSFKGRKERGGERGVAERDSLSEL